MVKMHVQSNSDHCLISASLKQAACRWRVAIGTCWFMSVGMGSDVEREASEDRKPRRGSMLSERKQEREWITQDTRRHQPPEPVPLLYTTPLYLLSFSKLVHFCFYSNQLLQRHLTRVSQNKKKKIFAGWFPTPSTRSRQGKERGRRQGTT